MNSNEIGIVGSLVTTVKGAAKVFRRLEKEKFINYEKEFREKLGRRKMSSMVKGETLF